MFTLEVLIYFTKKSGTTNFIPLHNLVWVHAILHKNMVLHKKSCK